MAKLYVGNLAFSVTDDRLVNAFGKFGEVESVEVVVDKSTGRSRGFAFVTMASVEEAQKAISELNGATLEGRPLVARPSEASVEALEGRPTEELALELLGGRDTLGTDVDSDERAHELVMEGIPAAAMIAFVSNIQTLPSEAVLAALGVSSRSFARRKAAPGVALPIDEGGRLWSFAETLAHAIRVFGTQAGAEAWLARPAIGLNRRTPLEMLRTPPGAREVSEHLTRLEYGVYT